MLASQHCRDGAAPNGVACLSSGINLVLFIMTLAIVERFILGYKTQAPKMVHPN